MGIVDLTRERLEETVSLLQRVFSYYKYSEEDFKASFEIALGIKSLEEALSKTEKHPDEIKEAERRLEELRAGVIHSDTYWNYEELTKIAGLIGLTIWKEGIKTREVWLGWFCVDPEFRGRKIGSILLDYAIDKAKELEFKKLLLLTTDLPQENAAQVLYESRGLKVYSRLKGFRTSKIGRDYNTLYRAMDL